MRGTLSPVTHAGRAGVTHIVHVKMNLRQWQASGMGPGRLAIAYALCI